MNFKYTILNCLYILLLLSSVACGNAVQQVSKETITIPANVSATSGNRQVSVNWTIAEGLEYNIYWNTTGAVSVTDNRILNITPPYIHGSLENGTTYYYIVAAVEKSVQSYASLEVSAVPHIPPPDVIATTKYTDITFNWEPVDGADSYNFYWGTAEGSYSDNKIGNVSPGIVHSLPGSETKAFQFVVSSVESTGEYYSDVMPVLLPPGQALSLQATAIDNTGQIHLAWDPTPGATAYNIYWSRFPDAISSADKIKVNTTDYYHEDRIYTVEYFYQITAENGGGEGPPSNVQSETALRILLAELFPDSELQKCTDENNAGNTTQWIYADEVDGLSCRRGFIKNISRIKHLQNAAYLEFSNNLVSDLSEIAHLTKLASLSVGYNSVTNIESLSNLTALSKLNLSGNAIASLSPLATLSSLNELNLNSTRITDEKLANLAVVIPNLTRLGIANNHIHNLALLSQLSSGLVSLDLANNSIDSIAAVPWNRFSNLIDLNLSFNKIADIGPLAFIPAQNTLTYLDLSNNDISNITPLINLSQLDSLYLSSNRLTGVINLGTQLNLLSVCDLSNNQITNVDSLSSLSALEWLYIGDNKIVSPVNLGGLNLLERLYVEENQLTNLNGLGGLSALTRLTAYDNRIADISAVKDLPLLNRLELDDNNLGDALNPFASGFTALELLELARNNLSEVSSFSSLNALLELDLDYNNINDVTALQNLPFLQYLDLRGNAMATGLVSLSTGFSSLVSLDLKYNNIADLNPMFAKDPLDNPISLLAVTILDLEGNQVADLSLLEALPSLDTLDIGTNNMTDEKILPLANLTALVVLLADDNDISDVSPLASLVNLELLYIDNNKIVDLSKLKPQGGGGPSNLSQLQARNNLINNVSVLMGFPMLSYLVLDGNRLSDASNLQALSGLVNLRYLSLNNNLIGNNGFAQLFSGNFPFLDAVYLENNAVTDITPLQNFVNLTSLHLIGNDIGDLAPLVRLVNLAYLSVGKNISDLTPLAGLKKLIDLSVGKNVRDLTPLLNLPRLGNITLANNNITNLDDLIGFTGLTDLRSIDFAGNSIRNVSVLKDFPKLYNLNLSSSTLSAVGEVVGLSDLVGLSTLNLSNNTISSLVGLEELINLVELDLNNNLIQNVGSLNNLTSLDNLYLVNSLNATSNLSGILNLFDFKTLDLAKNPTYPCSELTTIINTLGSPPVNVDETDLNDNYDNRDVAVAGVNCM